LRVVQIVNIEELQHSIQNKHGLIQVYTLHIYDNKNVDDDDDDNNTVVFYLLAQNHVIQLKRKRKYTRTHNKARE